MKIITTIIFVLIAFTIAFTQTKDITTINEGNKEMNKNVQTMIKVYIAGPYSKGDVAINVRNAFAAADTLADLGFAPFVPHSTHFWHMMFPRPYDFWLKLDKQFLPCCDALLRLPGESHGSDTEVEFAKQLNIPVFYQIDSLVQHFNKINQPK